MSKRHGRATNGRKLPAKCAELSKNGRRLQKEPSLALHQANVGMGKGGQGAFLHLSHARTKHGGQCSWRRGQHTQSRSCVSKLEQRREGRFLACHARPISTVTEAIGAKCTNGTSHCKKSPSSQTAASTLLRKRKACRTATGRLEGLIIGHVLALETTNNTTEQPRHERHRFPSTRSWRLEAGQCENQQES